VALPKVSLLLVAGSLLAAAAPTVSSAQNITIDGRFSAAQTLTGPYYSIGANLGKQVGSNLFHSFGQFSLVKGDTAAFTSTGSAAPINNVFGRVTGGNPSSIDGTIKSKITGANLFLINPSGVVFGPNATVNVSGAFHASTADYLKMADGAKFQATHPDGSTLSAAPPAAFGFLTASPARIAVNGSTLGVPAGQTLGLVGGPVSIAASPTATTGARLAASAGTIYVTSAAGAGEVPVDPRNTSAMTVSNFGSVDIMGRSKLRVSDPRGLRSGGSVFIRSGALTIDASKINADNYGLGPGGQLILQADSKIALTNKTKIHALARAGGSGGNIILQASPGGTISLDNSTVKVGSNASGDGGALSVTAGQLTLTNGAALKSKAKGSGNGGPITITADAVLLDGGVALDDSSLSTGIFSITSGTHPGSGSGGSITIVAGQLALHNGANVLAQSAGSGAGGPINVSVNRLLTVDSGGAVKSEAQGSGNGGPITITADAILLDGGVALDDSSLSTGIFSITSGTDPGSGSGGSITIVAGQLALHNGAGVLAQSSGFSAGGSVDVRLEGSLTVDSGASLGTLASDGGDAGNVTVMVDGAVTIDMTVGLDASLLGGISSLTYGSGNTGNLKVSAGALAISNEGVIAAVTFGSGDSGDLSVDVSGMLSISGPKRNSESQTGILGDADSGSSGNAGKIIVTAGTLSIINNGAISSGTFSVGNAGSVTVSVVDALTIDGTMTPGNFTGISSQANSGATGNAATVNVSAKSLSIINNGEISSGTFESGSGGNISVRIAGDLLIDGAGANPDFPTGISAAAEKGSSGQAGEVALITGGAITLSGGAQVRSTTAGTGKGGSVQVTAQGPLTLSDAGTGVVASSTAGGEAGSVTVNAPQIALMTGAQIASITAGTGAGGSVNVATPGALVLDGANTQIAASAIGPQSGPGGPVTVQANALTIQGGAQIASTTSGPGSGGPITVKVASNIVLPDPGPQITARSAGSGDAGSITVSAVRLLMSNGAAISTEAETSTASGGNITLNVGDLVYLLSSEITTSVKGVTGNGGNITIDPQLVVLNHSRIIAEAVEGHGGNITINAGAFIQSADSSVDASSEKGISGTVVITGPRVDVNGALVVLSSELRGHAAVLREACAAYGDRPISSLVEAGRGGLPQDPEATLPALYIADRDFSPNAPAGRKTEAKSAPLQTTVRLSMHCG
jgi:filamentous hemagglutinin family protein